VRLVALDAEAILALAAGGTAVVDGAPLAWPADDRRVLGYRRDALEADPASAPYLLHVLLDGRSLAGRIGGHGGPEGGLLEIGYYVLPAYRGRGVATAMVGEFLSFLGRSGVLRVRASVGPHNLASLAIVRRLGFEQVGQQVDAEDGLELVFERDLEPDRSSDVTA
jgi:[ribosomal protein S5]-alanine N-acetyltransferase